MQEYLIQCSFDYYRLSRAAAICGDTEKQAQYLRESLLCILGCYYDTGDVLSCNDAVNQMSVNVLRQLLQRVLHITDNIAHNGRLYGSLLLHKDTVSIEFFMVTKYIEET